MKIEINTVRGRRRPRPARRRGSPAVRPLTSSNTVGHGTRDTVRTIQYSHMVHTHERPRIKLSACPRCARALQYHCLTPMLTPVWYHSAHAPSTVQLAIWAAPARFVTLRRRRALSSCCRLAGFEEGKLPSCSRARPQPQAVEAASCSRLDRQTFCSRHVRREPSLLGLDVYGSSEPENQP